MPANQAHNAPGQRQGAQLDDAGHVHGLGTDVTHDAGLSLKSHTWMVAQASGLAQDSRTL